VGGVYFCKFARHFIDRQVEILQINPSVCPCTPKAIINTTGVGSGRGPNVWGAKGGAGWGGGYQK